MPLRWLFACVAFAALSASDARAQEARATPLSAPPPIVVVSREERSQLGEARDAKSRTRLSVELAEARLMRAEQLTTAQQFESAAREMGFYQGIIEDAIRYLKEQKEQKKLRDIYKRLELALRTHGSRLETMRRTTPAEFSVNVKTIMDNTKNLRTEALNGFYGDTVIREIEGDDNKAPAKETTTGTPKTTPED